MKASEVGVLRAMGMKRRKVAVGLVYESIAITAVCLIIGLGIGAAAAQPVSDTLLKEQVAAAESSSDTGTSMFYAGTQTDMNVEPLAVLDVKLNFKAVMLIILISLLLVLVSSVTGISFITKYEPIKILMDRS